MLHKELNSSCIKKWLKELINFQCNNLSNQILHDHESFWTSKELFIMFQRNRTEKAQVPGTRVAGIYVSPNPQANPAWRRFWGDNTFVVLTAIIFYKPEMWGKVFVVQFCIFAIIDHRGLYKVTQGKSPSNTELRRIK